MDLIIATIIGMIVSNKKAHRLAVSDPLVGDYLLCATNVERGIYHLYMYHPEILREVPFLVQESTIQSIKTALGMRDYEWRDFGRSALEDLAMRVRIELSGRPIISIK